jgi:hypothetical protein
MQNYFRMTNLAHFGELNKIQSIAFQNKKFRLVTLNRPV